MRHCAPTLAGMKTGSLFACSFESDGAMRDSVRKFNCLLRKRGLRVLPLRFCNNRALIYVYRPTMLLRDLRSPEAVRLLESRGYLMNTPEQCLMCLIKRLCEAKDFPHEIGLFLGYPPEDVSGFIENKAENCKYTGLWKVYGDEETAKKTFEKYRKCTALYCELFMNGTHIERLTVAC